MKSKKSSGGTPPYGQITAVGRQPLVEHSLKALEHVLAEAGKRVTAKSMAVYTEYPYCVGSITFAAGQRAVNTVLFTDESACPYEQQWLQTCTTLVLPYDEMRKQLLEEKEKEKIVEYSHNDDRADLVAKNITQTAEHINFELVGTGLIGRIKLKEGCGLSVENALALAGALLASDIALKEIANGLSTLESLAAFA